VEPVAQPFPLGLSLYTQYGAVGGDGVAAAVRDEEIERFRD